MYYLKSDLSCSEIIMNLYIFFLIRSLLLHEIIHWNVSDLHIFLKMKMYWQHIFLLLFCPFLFWADVSGGFLKHLGRCIQLFLVWYVDIGSFASLLTVLKYVCLTYNVDVCWATMWFFCCFGLVFCTINQYEMQILGRNFF